MADDFAARGVPVTGIELSRPMIGQLRTKADEAAIPVIAGDMATARARPVHARLPRLQRDLQPADPERAIGVFPQRRPAPDALWPVRH